MGLLKKYKAQSRSIQPDQLHGEDALPQDIAKLVTLRDKLLQDGKPDLFAHTCSPVALRTATIGALPGLGFGHLVAPATAVIGPEAVVGGLGRMSISRPVAPLTPTLPLSPSSTSGILVGQFNDTKQQGSYNVTVTASGISPVSKTRFIRKELVSVLVK